jgi:hypothetical protein
VGERRNAYSVLVGQTLGKRLLKKPVCRLKDNIKEYIKEMKWEGVDWIKLAEGRSILRAVVVTLINL